MASQEQGIKTDTAVEDVLSTFLRGSSLQSGCQPGLAHALKLSYNTIDVNRMSREKSVLTYRYKLNKDVPFLSVGICTALMDELILDACFRVNFQPGPSLSLQMQTELVPSRGGDMGRSRRASILDPAACPEIDIVNTVSKSGRSISFTRTEFRCPRTKRLLAFSSQVKYVPNGSRFLKNLYSTNPRAKDFYSRWYVHPTPIPRYIEKPLLQGVLLPYFKYLGNGIARFEVNSEHTNAYNGLHGGCHALVMELASEAFCKERFPARQTVAVLESLQIDYVGAGKLGTMDVECSFLGSSSECDEIVHTRVLLKQEGRLCSDGKLRWSMGYSRL